MSRATCLAEAWDAFLEDRAISVPHPCATAQARRDFMSGAMAAYELIGGGIERETLRKELEQFGRTVGTAAEAA